MDVSIRFNTAGGSTTRRVIGEIRRELRAAADGVTVDTQRAESARARIRGQETAGELSAARTRTSADRQRSREAIAASRAEAAESRKTAAETARAEASAMRTRIREVVAFHNGRQATELAYQQVVAATTAIVERETGRRVQAGSREHRQIELLARQSLATRARAEREATRQAEEEAEKRKKFNQAALSVASGVGGVVKDAAMTFHGNAQSDRQVRAQTDTVLNDALYQAELTGSEATSARTRVLALAERLGIDEGSLVQGLSAAQTETSLLSGGNAAERSANLDDALRNVELARNTRQDVGQVLRVGGIFKQLGVKGADADALMRTLIAESMGGAIELGNVSKDALGPMMQNIAARTSGLSGPERTAAIIDEFKRSMGVAEIARASGQTPRDSLNAWAKLQRQMTDDVTTGNLYDRLSQRRGSKPLLNEMFETAKDDRGQTVHRLKSDFRNPEKFLGRMLEIYKPTELLNVFHGGNGDPMIFDAQVRRLVGTLAQGDTGKRGLDKIREFAGMTLSDERIAAGKSMREGELVTQQTREAIQRRNSTDTKYNTAPSFTRDASVASNNAADFARRNPVTTTGILGGLALVGSNPVGLAAELGLGAGALAGEGITRLLDWGQEKATGRKRGNVDPISVLNVATWGELFNQSIPGAANTMVDAANSAAATRKQRNNIMAQFEAASPEARQEMIKGFMSSRADFQVLAQMIGQEMARRLKESPLEAKVSFFDLLHSTAEGATAKPGAGT